MSTPRGDAGRTRSTGSAGPTSKSRRLERLDTLRLPKGYGEIRAFMTVRNESTRLPFVLQHHRGLGVDRFFIVDNGSDDGTRELLLREPDVHVFSTRDSYAGAALGMEWMHQLLDEHGVGRWVALIDADEYLVYPGCESQALRDYCRAVERAGCNAISAMVVDMYPEGPIARAAPGDAPSLLHVCPFFDAVGYFITGVQYEMPSVHGGPRARVFWPDLKLHVPARQLEGLLDRVWDDEAYLQRHADVREAVATGGVRSGLEHFLRYGRFEGRRVGVRAVPEWPEQAYVEGNKGVAEAIAEGVIDSGLDHFIRFGQFEGRFPGADPSPYLAVCPVVRWSGDKRFLTARHHLRGATFNTSYEFGAAVLHFKMLDDFPVRAAAEAERGEHWLAGAEYRRYAAAFAADPKLSAHYEGSERYAGSHQLVGLGYMREAFQSADSPGGGAFASRWLRPLGRSA